MIKPRELDSLCKVMRKHKVSEFQHDGLAIKLSSMAHVEETRITQSTEQKKESDLFFSADLMVKKGEK